MCGKYLLSDDDYCVFIVYFRSIVIVFMEYINVEMCIRVNMSFNNNYGHYGFL